MNRTTRSVVIGGSSGMGLATAKLLTSDGGDVVLVGRSLERLEAARTALGGDVETIVADIGDRDQVSAMFARVGRCDHVVVTAANLAYGPIAELAEQDVMRGVRSKLLGPIFVAQECATRLESGGSITFTTGIAAQRPMRGGSSAAMVNSGLEGLVRALAIELAPLRVNAVSPGWTDTPIWDSMASITPERKRELFDQMANRLPVGRIGAVEDVAEAIVYLMRNRFTTGTVLDVDGGHRLV